MTLLLLFKAALEAVRTALANMEREYGQIRPPDPRAEGKGSHVETGIQAPETANMKYASLVTLCLVPFLPI